MRVTQMTTDHLHWVHRPGRKSYIRVRKVVPKHLIPLLGVATLTKKIEADNEPQARRLNTLAFAELEAKVQAAEARHSGKVVMWAGMPVPVVNGKAQVWNVPDPNARGPVLDPETVIPLWEKDRKTAAKPKAIAAKKRAMKRLFEFLKIAPDMLKVSTPDIQRFKDDSPYGDPYDDLVEIKALFSAARQNNRLPKGDPAAEVKLPAKRQKAERVALTDAEARLILDAARTAEPVVRWSNWIAAFTGAITSEIADADSRDVEIKDGIPVFHIRPKFRVLASGEKNNLKTDFRERTLPLHPAIADDLLAYVASLPPGPLFPQIDADKDGLRNTKASAACMKLIRGLGIENTKNAAGEDVEIRDFRSWRQRVATQLESGSPPITTYDRARFITGHAAGDVHAKNYLKHPPHELKKVIDQIPDPTS